MSIIRALVCVLALSIVLSGFLSAQDETAYTEFLPPAPTAAELGKYGLMPPVASSGVPGINVPLYNYSTTYINVPISLSYHSDGIKVKCPQKMKILL